MIKFITLYITLLTVSALTITVTLNVPLYNATCTAALGCILKTIAATIHNYLFTILGKAKHV